MTHEIGWAGNGNTIENLRLIMRRDLFKVKRLPKRTKDEFEIASLRLAKKTSPTSNVYYILFPFFLLTCRSMPVEENFPMSQCESLLLYQPKTVKKTSFLERKSFGVELGIDNMFVRPLGLVETYDTTPGPAVRCSDSYPTDLKGPMECGDTWGD
ncbi:hypothetical protein Tco_0619809 [Tanacetum coccineum]